MPFQLLLDTCPRTCTAPLYTCSLATYAIEKDPFLFIQGYESIKLRQKVQNVLQAYEEKFGVFS